MKPTLRIILVSLLVAVCMLIATPGCVTGPDGRKVPARSLLRIAERGAHLGTQFHLRNHPDDARKFWLATAGIESLANREEFDADDLGAILQTLPVNAFQGVEGALLVSDVVVIYDELAGEATRIDRTAWLKPMAAAIARGLRLGSKPPAPTAAPVLPPAPQYTKAEAKALGEEFRVAQSRALARSAVMRSFFPASVEPEQKILSNPFMWEGVFRCTGFQGSNTILRARLKNGLFGPQYPFPAFEVGCWNEPQYWIITTVGNLPVGILTGEHEACVFDPAPGIAQGFKVAAAPPWDGTMSIQHKSELTGSITNTAWYHSLP